ncbi:transforming growth factor beta activator LRRC32 [Xenopus tropicalis]|uniref:Transforming growth factor beta activator LRRC32 n=1 Tax=Xenopus tropicalis TaxID=8364 RepID=A0A8J1IPM7_XENTR|nr:transforming growth factor beta activator LRRC32 [Xenopus tropicalis]
MDGDMRYNIPKSTCPKHIMNENESEVHCCGLNIFDIPENLPRSIKTLDLSHNLITKITVSPISHLHSLQSLSLGYNQLEEIDRGAFLAVTQLDTLNLAANQLHKHYQRHDGVFASLPNLKILSLAQNHLDSKMVTFYLNGSRSLKKLDLSGNKMVTLSPGTFDGALHLTELDLANNDITGITEGTFDALQNLRTLNLAGNFIQCIASFDLTQLQVLNLSSNALRFFYSNDSQTPYQLSTLDLSQNNLKRFPFLPNIHKIQYLNLSGNNLVEMAPGSETTLENVESSHWFEAAEGLDLFSAIEYSNYNLSHLRDLDLSHNHLTSFPSHFLSNATRLENLNLAHNCITYMREEPSSTVSSQVKDWTHIPVTLNALKVLNLEGNSIQTVPQWLFKFLPNIQHLNLKGNNVILRPQSHPKMINGSSKDDICTNFSRAPKLKYLNLGHNYITQLPPRAFHHTPLAVLDLSENLGLTLEESTMEGLEESLQFLSLQGNQMNESQAKLPCLKSLQFLNMSNNKLRALPANLYCSHVDIVDLRNNDLRMLDNKAALAWASSLTHLYIKGNPFSCCSLNWLKILQAGPVRIWDLEEAHCIYLDNNSTGKANVTGDHTKHCFHQTISIHSIIVIIISFIALTSLTSAVYFLCRKGRPTLALTCKFRSNKVAAEPASPPKAVKSREESIISTP